MTEPTYNGIPLGSEELYPKDPGNGPRYLFLSEEARKNIASHRPPDRIEILDGKTWEIWTTPKKP